MKLHLDQIPHITLLAISIIVSQQSLAEIEVKCEKPIAGETEYGPFNYITQKSKLPIVEKFHFTEQVASLIKGESTTYVDGDINYTLTKFPNHHRALESLGELAIREKTSKLPHMRFTVACYYIRASKFDPSDGMVNAIYSKYLARIGQKELAKEQAELALKKNPDHSRVAYTVGMTYFYIGEIKKAKEYSDIAKKLGSSAVGLDKLLSNPANK